MKEEKNINPKDLQILKAVFGEDVLTRPIPSHTSIEEDLLKEFIWWLGNNYLPIVSAMHFEMFLNSKKAKP